MIVGENRYSSDLIINVTRAKELTNMRMSTKEQKVVLKAPRLMSLENCLAYLNDDELLEITPLDIPHAEDVSQRTGKKSGKRRENRSNSCFLP
jgi:GTP-binding protein